MHKKYGDEDRRAGDRRSGRNQRIEERISCSLNVTTYDIRRKTPTEAKAVSISKHGMGLIINSQLYSGDSIEIAIQGKLDEPVQIEGKVVWCKEISSTEFRAGIVFTSPLSLNELIGQ